MAVDEMSQKECVEHVQNYEQEHLRHRKGNQGSNSSPQKQEHFWPGKFSRKIKQATLLTSSRPLYKDMQLFGKRNKYADKRAPTAMYYDNYSG